eukprot:scaffold10402_cov18-Tisochrysis_lutea.AAC.1
MVRMEIEYELQYTRFGLMPVAAPTRCSKPEFCGWPVCQLRLMPRKQRCSIFDGLFKRNGKWPAISFLVLSG